MSLKDLNLKGLYDSDRDNLLNDFYIPVLSNSVKYKRIAGFFSSNALAIAAKGISKFIENGGKIQLIANVIISEEDQEAIKKAIEEKEKKIIHEIETMDDALKKGHIRLLAWMIKNDKLEIKIAVLPKGIEHKKKGVLEDSEGTKISFSGSDNETMKGWLENDEEFHVFCDWIEGDKERHLDPDIKGFDILWNDLANKVMVFPISEAFKKGFLKTAPKDDEEFKRLSKEVIEELIKTNNMKYTLYKKPESKKINKHNLESYLRPYQKDAIDAWKNNQYKGILKMATGTGKTFVAISAMKMLFEKKENQFVVIAVPTQLLVSQWFNELKDLGYTNIIKVMADRNKWSYQLKGSILKNELGHEKEIIIVSTYDSFCSDHFKQLIEKWNGEKLLICDEVHHSWAPTYKTGLLDSYNYRLGLSATPERYMDDLGTKHMQEYFSGIVYEFNINQAIPDFLVEYEYYAEIVELTQDEKLEYEKLSHYIAKKIAQNKGEIDEDTFIMILKRAKITTNSESKWAAFEKILDDIGNMKKTLIYCSDKQIEKVKYILRSRRITAHEITYRQPLNHRNEIIRLFESDDYQAIVAMKVLDEGIDVPGIERAIILASSGNPIEFIQRRGRILRKSKNKNFSKIHDILVFPWKDVPEHISDTDLSVIHKEIARIEEFAKSSSNPLEVMNKITKYKRILINT